MFEFLWFVILIASLVGAFNCSTAGRAHREAKPIDDTWREKVWRCLAWTWRWWLVVAVLVLVAGVYLANNGLRAGLDLLLFFRRHWIWMTLLLVMSLLGFVLAWRGEWTVRRLVVGAALSAAVTLLLALEWYCLFISLLLLGLLGLLLMQRDRLPRLRWVGSMLIVFLAAGLILSHVVTLPKSEYDLATWFAGIADYVLIVVLLVLAFSAVVWVRSLHLQPLGWVSATMILFLGSGLFFSHILYGDPEDFAEIEDQFKYGSVGSDHFMARGIPYFIWEVLPVMFPPEDILVEILPEDVRETKKAKYAPRYGKADKPKGVSYEAFGLVKEKDHKARLVGQHNDPIERPIGFSKRQVFGMDFIGINCAFCHVSTIRKNAFDKPDIILGMPANTADIELYFLFMFGVAEKPEFDFWRALSSSVRPSPSSSVSPSNRGPKMPVEVIDWILQKHPEMKFGSQVGKYGISGVCQEIRNSIHRLSYRLALIPLTGRYMRLLKKQFYFIDPHYRDRVPRFGPGRVETWGPAKRTLVTPPLPVPYPGGIVDYPPIWNQKARKEMRFHWDGSIDDPQERNIIAGLVVSGPNKECLDTERLDRIKNLLDGRPAPRYADFVPSYQLQGYGDELVNRREQGRVIFQHWCASCHAPDGDRIGRVEPFAALKTDAHRAKSFTEELAEGLNKLKTDSWRLKSFKSQHGYVNVLLDGIWLRAPYLHNGSVPTMRDLLNKPCEGPDKPTCRPRKFYRGQDIYDWKNLGFKSEVTIEPGDNVDIAVRNEPAQTAIIADERGMITVSGVEINAWGLTAAEVGEKILIEHAAKALMEKSKITLMEARDIALVQVTAEGEERLKNESNLTKNDAKAWVHRQNPLATVQIHKKIPVTLFEFDTTEFGNSNSGHLYGTDLSPDEKKALIEYLKTL
jgi:processive rubber oxygenase RoxA-like protein